jgi:Protein of unknown function (DUF2631)
VLWLLVGPVIMGAVSDATGRGQGHQTSARVIEQSNREEGIVRAGETPITHERPEDWGWHGESGKTGRIAGIVTIVILLLLTQGNHEGHVEDLWLIGGALFIAIALIRDSRRRKNAWRSH